MNIMLSWGVLCFREEAASVIANEISESAALKLQRKFSVQSLDINVSSVPS